MEFQLRFMGNVPKFDEKNCVELFGEVYTGSYNAYENISYSTPVNIITGAPMTYDKFQVAKIIIEDLFGSDMRLEINGGLDLIWFKNMQEIARTGFVEPWRYFGPVSKYGYVHGKYGTSKHLICRDAIFVDTFANKIDFPDVHGGIVWRDQFWAFSTREVRNIDTGETFDVSHLGTLMEFVGGFLIFGKLLTNSVPGIELSCGQVIYQEETPDPTKCLFCKIEPSRFMTYNCGHSVICNACHEKMAPVGDAKICPVCKEKITIAVATIPR